MAAPFKMKGMEFKSPVKHNKTAAHTYGTGENKKTSRVQVAHNHTNAKGTYNHDTWGNPHYHKKTGTSKANVNINVQDNSEQNDPVKNDPVKNVKT